MDWSTFFKLDAYAYCWSIRGTEEMQKYGGLGAFDDCLQDELGWTWVVHLLLIFAIGTLIRGLSSGDWSTRE